MKIEYLKDESYVACALAIGADVWSRDRHLRYSRIKCLTIEELAELLLK
ncbi:MAG: hypothetical protein M1594_00125 [Candidatus Marsarchaeota archaeon]|nr:hypothetical protein [Candidatus Marsarchaeota archaeon]